jgi:hypothetical protein
MSFIVMPLISVLVIAPLAAGIAMAGRLHASFTTMSLTPELAAGAAGAPQATRAMPKAAAITIDFTFTILNSSNISVSGRRLSHRLF